MFFFFWSYVKNGVLHIKPTFTADRFGQDFLYNGTLDLWPEGCNVNYLNGCVAWVHKKTIYYYYPICIDTLSLMDSFFGWEWCIKLSLLLSYNIVILNSAIPTRTSSIQFNLLVCELSIRLVLLSVRLKFVLKCLAVIGSGPVTTVYWHQLFINHNALLVKNAAIWLMPTGNRFGAWPRSGEIDMVEIRSNDDLICSGQHVGNRLMGSTLHFGN